MKKLKPGDLILSWAMNDEIILGIVLSERIAGEKYSEYKYTWLVGPLEVHLGYETGIMKCRKNFLEYAKKNNL